MAGIFGLFDFTKPGKGIEKDQPEKHPFFLFFELVWRKLGRLILLNMIFFVALLPILTVAYFLIDGFLFGLMEQMGVGLSEMTPNFLHSVLSSLMQRMFGWLFGILVSVSAVLYGPVCCGMTFTLRNFARQQHTWNSDFFDKFRQNFKQGLALGLIDLVLLSLFAFNFTMTSGIGATPLLTVVRYLSIGLFLIYMLMRNYFFVMAVTFRLKLSQILKNAWIFAILGLWRNLLVFVTNGVLFIAVLIFPLVELIAVPFLLFSFTGFLSMFVCFPVVEKYLITPQAQAVPDMKKQKG